jgi:hypothetical protein
VSVWDDRPAPPPITSARPWEAEGARVALVSCVQCGAALLLDPGNEFDVIDRHVSWHINLRARS